MLRQTTLSQATLRTPNGTALPTRRSPYQSQRHSATHTLPATQNGTAPPTRRPPRQCQRHSASDATRPPLIPTAQRHKSPPRRPRSRPILRAQRIGHIANARVRHRSRSRQGTNTQLKTRTLRYAFREKGRSSYSEHAPRGAAGRGHPVPQVDNEWTPRCPSSAQLLEVLLVQVEAFL